MNAIPLSISEKKAHVWARDDLDWYVEPEAATEALLGVEAFIGATWDPACGGGNIIAAFDRLNRWPAAGTDIVKRVQGDPNWWCGEFDFLKAERPRAGIPNLPFPERHATNIVTNPPFFKAAGAEAFIRKALSIADGKVAAFVDVKFLAGAKRANGLFAEHPPHRIWIITPRVSCPPGHVLASGGKAQGGTADWCWLVWDMTIPFGGTALGWLRRGIQEGSPS